MKDRVSLVLSAGMGEKVIEVGEGQKWSEFLIGRSSEADLFLNDPGVSRRHCRLFSVPVPSRSRISEARPAPSSTASLSRKRAGPGTRRDQSRRRGASPADRRATRRSRCRPNRRRRRSRSHHRNPTRNRSRNDPRPRRSRHANRSRHPVRREANPWRFRSTPRSSPALQPVEAKPGENILVDLTRRARLVIGRDRKSDLTLDYPVISRRHTEIRTEGRGFLIRDLGSTNGTFVNGEQLGGPQALEEGDVVGVGPHRLTFDGRVLFSKAPPEIGTRIEVTDLGRQVIHRETRKPFYLLQNIQLTVEPKEFIGLLGSAGCGKSTFIDTVNGRRPATEGKVLYNGENLYNHFDAFKQGIGYVPQQLIFHSELPLADVLRFASRLRLPDDTTDREIEENIDRVLETVGLSDRKGILVRNLSGGQKKRVSIAIELLARPTLLFLDEATSGLDLGTEAQMMRLFRELADGGVTTMCITHYIESLEMCDVLAYFMRGRLIYYGPPTELKAYFGVDAMRDVYIKETEKTPEVWEKEFQESETYQKFVLDRPPSRTPRSTRSSAAANRSPRRRCAAVRSSFMS